jgi:hypothetical protein
VQDREIELCNELLKCEVTSWERDFLQDILKRNDKWNITLSVKQQNVLKKLEKKHMEGEDVDRKEFGLPEKYDGLSITHEEDGYHIVVNGVPMRKPTTKKEGLVIMAWLDGLQKQLFDAMQDHQGYEEDEETDEIDRIIEMDAPVEKEDEDLPF